MMYLIYESYKEDLIVVLDLDNGKILYELNLDSCTKVNMIYKW